MLELKNISKKYGKVTALKSVNITLGSGIYALLGPNGSGKSTMMNIISGILPPTDGEILYNGQGIRSLGTAYRERIGYMPQYPGMYPSFTVRDFLLYMSELKGLPRGNEGEVDYILRRVELDDCADRKISALSGGMKQRLSLAQAVLGSPEIIILDEPTAGLDPAGRESILKNIRDYQAAQQAAVVMVSHSMEEIASNVDRLIVMEKGTAVMTGAPSEVFSHAAELVSMGLNVPCMTQVLLRLQQLGVNVPASAYTVEQAADLLEPLLKGGAQIC